MPSLTRAAPAEVSAAWRASSERCTIASTLMPGISQYSEPFQRHSTTIPGINSPACNGAPVFVVKARAGAPSMPSVS
ncbi:hypothetical protein [Sagittula stellata]|nr:hypothetical protein [Sagittula stellata]